MQIKGFKDTIAWYDANAEEYTKQLQTVAPIGQIKKFLTFLPKHPKILEAGCGPGRESKIFIEHTADVMGVDISKNLLAIAKHDNPKAEYVQANFINLPIEDNVFDGVFAHASLVHLETIEEVKQALKEFYRVLQPKGILYVRVKLPPGSQKTAIVSDTLSHHDRFFRYYLKEEMRDYLVETGFKILESYFLEDENGRPEVKWVTLIARKNI